MYLNTVQSLHIIAPTAYLTFHLIVFRFADDKQETSVLHCAASQHEAASEPGSGVPGRGKIEK